MTRTAPTESATVTTAWHITIDDPILLALHGWRAARAAPDTAELLGYRPPYPCMSQNLALALLLTSTATGLSERAGDYGLRVTATSPRIPRPCPDGDGPAGCGPSIGSTAVRPRRPGGRCRGRVGGRAACRPRGTARADPPPDPP